MPLFTSIKPATTTALITSDAFRPTAPGTYRWVAAYSGDANNAPVAGVCGAAGESVVVAAAPTGAPALSHLKLKPTSFKAGHKGASLASKGGAKITYSDSQAATTTFTVLHKKGKHLVTVGSFSHTEGEARHPSPVATHA